MFKNTYWLIIPAVLSLGLISCTTYYIPIESFNEQFRGIDSTSLKIVNTRGPNGIKYSYPANTIDTIYCIDEKGNSFQIENSPSIEIRFTNNNEESAIFYFDTIFLQDSLIMGAKSRFLPLRDILPLNTIKLIEVQDGKKDFIYD